jgi:hypothetical protein
MFKNAKKNLILDFGLNYGFFGFFWGLDFFGLGYWNFLDFFRIRTSANDLSFMAAFLVPYTLINPDSLVIFMRH